MYIWRIGTIPRGHLYYSSGPFHNIFIFACIVPLSVSPGKRTTSIKYKQVLQSYTCFSFYTLKAEIYITISSLYFCHCRFLFRSSVLARPFPTISLSNNCTPHYILYQDFNKKSLENRFILSNISTSNEIQWIPSVINMCIMSITLLYFCLLRIRITHKKLSSTCCNANILIIIRNLFFIVHQLRFIYSIVYTKMMCLKKLFTLYTTSQEYKKTQIYLFHQKILNTVFCNISSFKENTNRKNIVATKGFFTSLLNWNKISGYSIKTGTVRFINEQKLSFYQISTCLIIHHI